MGNVPIGVVPSPSRRFRPTPFTPPRAGYGAPAATQQTPERLQIQAVAYVVRAVDASTVISWRAEAGGGRGGAVAAVAGGRARRRRWPDTRRRSRRRRCARRAASAQRVR